MNTDTYISRVPATMNGLRYGLVRRMTLGGGGGGGGEIVLHMCYNLVRCIMFLDTLCHSDASRRTVALW